MSRKQKDLNARDAVWPVIFFIVVGALGIWDGLVDLATRTDPIFGNLSNHDPKWAALAVLIGVVFLMIGMSMPLLVLILKAIEKLRERINDLESK